MAAQGAAATLQVGARVVNHCWAHAGMGSVGLRCVLPAAVAVRGSAFANGVRLGRVEREFVPDGRLRLTVLF